MGKVGNTIQLSLLIRIVFRTGRHRIMRALASSTGAIARPEIHHVRLRLRCRSLLASVRSASTDTDARKAYSHTLLLPKTALPLKQRNPAEAEKAHRARTTDELYRLQVGCTLPCNRVTVDPAVREDRPTDLRASRWTTIRQRQPAHG